MLGLKQLLTRLTISQKVVLFTILMAILIGSLGGFFVIQQAEDAVLEEKRAKLVGIAKFLDQQLGESYDEILKREGAYNAPREKQVAVLNSVLTPIAEKALSHYPEVRVGYYSKNLEAPVVYVPLVAEIKDKIGIPLPADHPGRKVFTTGDEQLTAGQSQWGNALSYRRPLYREGTLIGYVAANEPLSRVAAAKTAMVERILSIIFISIIISIFGAYLISRQLVSDIHRIKQGVETLTYKLDKPLPEVYGELGEIAKSINQMAASLHTLQESGKLLSTSLDQREICDRALEMVTALLKAKYATISLLDPRTGTLDIKAYRGLPPEAAAMIKMNPGEGLAGLAFSTGEPVSTMDIPTDPRSKYPVMAQKWNLSSSLAVPFSGKNAPLGVIQIFMEEACSFSQNEEELLLSVAYQVGLAIENAQLYEKTAHLAITDSLTGLYNYHYFQESLGRELEESRHGQRPVSLIMLDIDNFKIYNDTFGHLAGDHVLEIFSSILQKNVRERDLVARYGGEEFSVILVDSDAKLAVDIAENIRRDVEAYPFYGREQQPGGKLTVSIGIASFPLNAGNKENLLNKADEALYKAKFANKNKVELYFSVLDEMKGDLDQSEQSLINTVKTLITVINAKDRYTYGHSERVVEYCGALSKKLGLNEDEARKLRYAAFLHDIGKMEIDREILNKCEPLNKKDWRILKQHPLWGTELLRPVQSLKNVIPIILHHHERYDGKGYPDKLAGEEIPYGARILAVADSFDAMTVMRGYRKARTVPDAVKELQRCSGTQFDPQVVDAFLEIMPRLKPDEVIN